MLRLTSEAHVILQLKDVYSERSRIYLRFEHSMELDSLEWRQFSFEGETCVEKQKLNKGEVYHLC